MKKVIFLLTAFVLLVGIGTALGQVKKTEKKPAQKNSVSQESKSLETTYHALIIGNNRYKYLPKLNTAQNDAIEVEKILKEKFKFQTVLLLDATRANILGKINEMRKRLGEKDSLLIYYAGHGEYDKTVDKAYWLPVDAQGDDPTNWIIADDITSNIKRIPARHVLIVSDSCFSGTITRQAVTELISTSGRDGYLKKMQERPSRTLMASGGNEPVSDSGGGNNSVFAAAFIKSFKEIDKESFTAEEIFHTRIKEIVAGRSDQVPEYNNIKNSGHEGGDFVFWLAKMEVEPFQTATDIKLQSQEEYKQLEEDRKKIEAERRRLEMEKVNLGLEKKRIEQEQKLKEERQRLEAEKKQLEEDKKILAEQKRERQAVTMAPRPSQSPPTSVSYTEPMTGIEMVLIKGGCYQMGDNFNFGEMSEQPVHEVCVDDFYLGKYEVTQGQWKLFMEENPSYFKKGDNYPVESVSWKDIQEFIRKLNERTGKKYRLPTEAEWEYAARSGGKRENWAGTSNESEIESYSWYNKNSKEKTHPVGEKLPNGLGLFDMTGNVKEWCQDGYNSGAYKKHFRKNPINTSGISQVIRGGSWEDSEGDQRAARREYYLPGRNKNFLGFRLAFTY